CRVEEGPVVGREHVDRLGGDSAQHALKDGVVDLRRPVPAQGAMMVAVDNDGKNLVERDLVASVGGAAQLLVGGVGGDPVDPRSEQGLAPEELLSRVRHSDADRDPAGSYGGGVHLSVLLAGLAKSRVQPVLVYFQVEGALGNPELFGNPRQVAL